MQLATAGHDYRQPKRSPGLGAKGLPAVVETAPDLGHGVVTSVLVFDVRRDWPPLVAEQREDFPDRRIALTPWDVGALLAPAIFQVNGGDVLMVIAEEGDRVEIRGGEVGNIEINRDRRMPTRRFEGRPGQQATPRSPSRAACGTSG